MPKYFDIHNHLFNKNFLAKELLYRLMKEVEHILQPKRDDDEIRGFKETASKLKKAIETLKRVSYAIKIFTKKNSEAIYKELDKTYQGEFILTPLTFDLTYCFAPTADRSGETTSKPVKKIFDQEMEKMFSKIEKRTRTFARDFNDQSSAEENKLWDEYLKAKKQFLENADMLNEQHNENISRQAQTRGIITLPDEFDGFEEQIRQLKELKDNPAYKDMVFPFLAVDPRRKNILEYAKENVGKGKLFIGVKLYCPNGYSPTDPLLFGPEGERGGIYAFCEDNGIPITAHNSDGGFATLSKSVEVNGLIHCNGQLEHLNKELLTFKNSILAKDAVYERAVTLNHPLIWEKVVEKYPRLLLNLAHFGGGKQLDGALDNLEIAELWSNRIIALLKDRRYKVYTDLSCFSDFSILKKFASSTVYPDIKNKVLYGSDFILLLLFENDFSNNLKQFKEVFGSDFETIASTNPQEFLKHVL